MMAEMICSVEQCSEPSSFDAINIYLTIKKSYRHDTSTIIANGGRASPSGAGLPRSLPSRYVCHHGRGLGSHEVQVSVSKGFQRRFHQVDQARLHPQDGVNDSENKGVRTFQGRRRQIGSKQGSARNLP
jgi:hypothetical protein